MASKTYIVIRPENKKQRKLDGKINIADGYMLVSRNKKFLIGDSSVTHIKVTDKNLVHNLVKKKVDNRFEKLLKSLVMLLISDDDTGESVRLILDKIEKFRLEIKNKYKAYLKKKELDEMAKQLVHIQKEAHMKMVVVRQKNIFEPKVEDAASVGKSR